MTKAEMVEVWKTEYDDLREQLYDQGNQSNTLEYNLLSARALRLHECLLDLVEMDNGIVEDR